VDWPRVEQGFDAGQGGRERDTSGGNIEASGAVAQQPTPVCEPAEAAFHDPAAFEHDEALLLRVTLDHVVAHAVFVRPFPATLGDEAAVENSLPQARPFCLACVQGGKRVALLRGRRHNGDGKPGAVGVDQSYPFAAQTFLAASYPRGPRTGMHLTDCVSMMPRLWPVRA